MQTLRGFLGRVRYMTMLSILHPVHELLNRIGFTETAYLAKASRAKSFFFFFVIFPSQIDQDTKKGKIPGYQEGQDVRIFDCHTKLKSLTIIFHDVDRGSVRHPAYSSFPIALPPP